MKTKIQWLYKAINGSLLIKLLFPSLLLFFSFRPGKGTWKPESPVILKEVKVEEHFQSVRIDGDISIILTNEPAGTLMMEASEKVLNRIRFKVKNNELIIDAYRKNRLDKLTIYLSATRLKSMLVNGNASISSEDVINQDNFQIWLNGITNIKIKTTGKVSVDAYDSYDLLWESPVIHH